MWRNFDNMPDQRGFTLMETLVALMILATALVMVLQLFSGALNSSRLSGEYTRAIFHAQEKMNEILLETQLAESEQTGDFGDGFRWKATILWIDPNADITDETKRIQSPLDLFYIKVTVSWDSGMREREFDVSTVHIAEKLEIPAAG